MIINLTRHAVLARHVETAQTPWRRMKGLLGAENLAPDHALVITHCQSIHMFFMKFPIDVIFCDRDHKVVGICQNIQPFGLSPIFFNASFAIELAAGVISATKTSLGDQIEKKS
jgi:uncharacterized membrane protein (UPF0127 family)